MLVKRILSSVVPILAELELPWMRGPWGCPPSKSMGPTLENIFNQCVLRLSERSFNLIFSTILVLFFVSEAHSISMYNDLIYLKY